MSAKAVNAFCRKNFTAFKHRIIPAYEGVRHLNFLDKYLMEVARFLETGSGIRRLIVETPPRHGKSLTISEAFPAWLLGRNPHLNVIIASYAASLAELHSRIARGFVQDQTFGEVFPNFKLSEDNQRVDEWGTQDTDGRKGGLVAVGFGGTVVGKGSHCFPAGTMVDTEIGQVDIETLCHMVDKPRVLCYNHRSGTVTLGHILATSKRDTGDFIRLTLTSGKVILSTPEHPFYVPNVGYVTAENLKPHAPLYGVSDPNVRLMRNIVPETSAPTQKSTEVELHSDVLRCGLFQKTPQIHLDAVYLVERVRAENQPVYDIQVERFHNFFAESILVHNCLIIDDPHKGRDEAESKDQREKTWNAYTNDFLTRANNSNQFAQIVVAQRYHDDDLIGRLLREQEGEWVHVRLPALAEENDMLGRAYGEALWPERFPVAALENRRQVMGDYPFASQYQQRPIPKGEQVFEVDKIEVVTRAPAGLVGVRFYDLAITAKAKSDYTVGLKMAIDPANEDIYVLDVFRQKTKPAALLAAIKSHAFKDGKEWDVALEGEKAGIMNIDYLSRDKDLRGFKLHLDPIKGDKYARAQAVMSRVALGQVKILRAAWNRAFIEELRIFDSGAHDDQVDAFSGAYNFLAEQVVPEASVVRAGSWYGDEATPRQMNQPSPDFWS